MDIHNFFDEQVITSSKLPKERRRYTYYDVIAFAKIYAEGVNENSNRYKAIFQSDDPHEIKMLAKSKDMALCLWEIVHNGWRDFRDTDYDYEKAWDKINDILSEHHIDVDDLVV